MDKLAKDEKTGEYFTVYTEKPIMLISDDKKKWFVQTSPRELELEAKLLEMESKLKQNEWISVEDRLPESRDEVLFYVKKLKQIELGKFNQTNAKWMTPHRDTYFQTGFNWVTHWMPLPTPPTGE